jgi:type I restriction enzyme S subunit
MREFNIPLPPKPTQQAIVSKIEELFSELDKGIENLHIAQQQLKTYRQSVLKWAFEGKLTNENVKEGELLEGWRNVSITELAEKNRHALKAGPFGSSLKKEFYVVKGYKIYGQEQVIKDNPFYGDYYVNEEKYKELSSCKIKPFDILISLVGTVGKVLLLPENCQAGIINPRLIKISLDRNVYLPKFFKYYFESSAVKSFYGAETRGTTMDVLNLGIIKTIPFPLCSIQEQEKIIKAIESRLSVADKMEESITQSLQQAEALRQSILKKAFEGRLI